MSEVIVNFIAFNEARDTCQMVLVEGPWDGDIEDHLRSLQDRMFGCPSAALDGHLAAQFPEANVLNVLVRVDCYDVPRDDVEAFFWRFTDGIAAMSDYSIAGSQYVRKFLFEVASTLWPMLSVRSTPFWPESCPPPIHPIQAVRLVSMPSSAM